MTKTLVIGKDGQLGRSVTSSLHGLVDISPVGRKELDLADTKSLQAFIREHKPNCIVNCAAFTSVDLAEEKPDEVNRINALSLQTLATEAKKLGSLLVHFSTDYVFDGLKHGEYFETDTVSPINVYGISKARAEHYIRDVGCKHLILRSGWLYGPGHANFPTKIIKRFYNNENCHIVSDCFGAPTSTRALAEALHEMLKKLYSGSNMDDRILGTYHLACSGSTSWYEYAKLILEMGKKYHLVSPDCTSIIYPIKTSDLKLAASRPKNCILNTDKIRHNFGITLPDWKETFKDHFDWKGQ